MYATQADMVKRYGESDIIALTDREHLTGAIVVETLQAAIADAVNLIHGYLGKRYKLPLNPVPPLATRWTVELARWFLQPNSAPEQVKANFERAIEELKAARDGDLSLDAEEASPLFSGTAELVGPERIFEKMNGF